MMCCGAAQRRALPRVAASAVCGDPNAENKSEMLRNMEN